MPSNKAKLETPEYKARLLKFSKKLKEEREKLGISQGELAKRAKLSSHAVISRWEGVANDERGGEYTSKGAVARELPDISDLLNLCDIFNCDLDYILGFQEQPRKGEVDVARVLDLNYTAVRSLTRLKYSAPDGGNRFLNYLFEAEAFEVDRPVMDFPDNKSFQRGYMFERKEKIGLGYILADLKQLFEYYVHAKCSDEDREKIEGPHPLSQQLGRMIPALDNAGMKIVPGFYDRLIDIEGFLRVRLDEIHKDFEYLVLKAAELAKQDYRAKEGGYRERKYAYLDAEVEGYYDDFLKEDMWIDDKELDKFLRKT